MLQDLDECADRIEAGNLFFCEGRLSGIASQLRKGEVAINTLGHLRREAERLIEACKSVDAIVATHQGRPG